MQIGGTHEVGGTFLHREGQPAKQVTNARASLLMQIDIYGVFHGDHIPSEG